MQEKLNIYRSIERTQHTTMMEDKNTIILVDVDILDEIQHASTLKRLSTEGTPLIPQRINMAVL